MSTISGQLLLQPMFSDEADAGIKTGVLASLSTMFKN